MAESRTPRRRKLFSSLLKKYFSVFTRSGSVLACRSRDAAPLRVADAEAVQRLAGDGGGGTAHPEQRGGERRWAGPQRYGRRSATCLPPLLLARTVGMSWS